MKKKIYLSLVVLLVTSSSIPAAIIIEVPSAPYSTIQAGIDAAASGDTVLIHPGTYTGDGNRDIDFNGKSITVRSKNPSDPCVVAATIIDCKGTQADPHRGFNFSNNQDCNAVIDGLTIINGCVSDGGGAIGCRNNQQSTLLISNCNINNNTALEGTGRGEFGYGGGISIIDGICLLNNCTITANSADDYGGGIFSEGSADITISNCKITKNQAIHGAGFFVGGSAAKITNCRISNNTAISVFIDDPIAGGLIRGRGGGIIFSDGINVMNNCIITGNKAQDGDGGGIFDSSDFQTNLIMNNCTIYANVAGRRGGGVYGTYGTQHYSSMNNIIVWDNEALYGQGMYFIRAGGDGTTPPVNYSNIQGGWPGVGNIDTDPCFVQPGIWDTNGTPEDVNDVILLQGDYHLLPASLCIDTGDPCYVPATNETDLDGSPRIANGRIDMGAYESDYIKARLWFFPRTINRRSRMRKVMAWIRLPEGVTKDRIAQDTPLLLYPGRLEPINQYIFEHGRKGRKRTSIFILYDKAELLTVVSDNGLVEVKVIGSLNTGQNFCGSDAITILERQQPNQWRLLKNK